jgi:chromosome segregation ATPase
MSETVARRNGPQPKPPAPPPDESYRAHVEATFARYDEVRKDRDALREQLDKAINAIKAATDTETLLRDEIASLRRQLEESHLRCLQAMAERAAYETLFSGFHAQMREFNIPAVPLVRDLSHVQQPMPDNKQ